MTDIRYIQSTERQVGEAHPTLSDTLNRALRDVLTASGVDPDADFNGFASGLSGAGSPEGTVTAGIGQTYRQTDGSNGSVLWVKNSGTGNTGWRVMQTSLGVFNVKDYGATGDGSTDDATAIQAAIDAAEVAGGQVVFPAGTYKVSTGLTVQANGVHLVGSGKQSTTLSWGGGAAKMFTLGQTGTPIYRWSITGMELTDASSAATHAVYMEYAREGAMTDVWVNLGFTTTAIHLAGTVTDGNWTNRLTRVQVSSTAGEGIYFGPQSNAIICEQCHFTSCTGAHVVFGQAQGVKFIGCQFEQSASGYELLIDGRISGARMLGVSISDCYFELLSGSAGARAFAANESGGNAVNVDSCSIAGCFIWGSGTATYLIESNVASGGARFAVEQCALFGAITAGVRATNANDFPIIVGYRALTGYGTGSTLPLLDDNSGAAASAQSVTISGGNLVSSAGMSLGDDLTLTKSVSRVVPGATSFAIRNHANSADNLLLTDAGVGTFRSSVSGVTEAANTNSTKLATTAYVDRATTRTAITSAAPTGTTSATAKMMGLAGSITPTRGTRILIFASGQLSNDTINDGATVDLRYGTGSAPANADAVTGTLAGIAQTMTAKVAADRSGFSLLGYVTGLTVGTAYWLDLSLLAVTGGTATVTGVSLVAVEEH